MQLKIKTLVLAGAMFAAGMVGIETASAMPVAREAGVAVSAPIEQAGYRCGPGWVVNGWGRCVPVRRYGYAPRRAYRPYGRPHRHW